MKKKSILFLCLLLSSNSFSADSYMFRLKLSDKNGSGHSKEKPETFLSKKSIERRKNQHINIDDSDIPISPQYLDTIKNLGYTVVTKSKWLNTVCILSADSSSIEKLKDLNFVQNITFVWKSHNPNIKKVGTKKKLPTTKQVGYYGYASDQITTVNGQHLHQNGFYGDGMEIAVIDVGFKNFHEILLLDNLRIKGIKDFVYNGTDIFESSDHGIGTLSTMAGNYANEFVGTAPNAKYWLLRSEDSRSEYPIEEDYWASAVEYADSVGVDLINTSLGYSLFDPPAESYNHSQLDGKTSFMTQIANIATEKGIFMVVSAGNEGAKTWQKVTVPADAKNVLTVGAMDKDSTIARFSSKGPTFDGRIKPDVVALGSDINVISGSGDVVINSGTSFAGPVMCGLAACLWQAYPELTNLQLLDIIKQSSSKYNSPGESYGYGIPNMQIAMQIAGGITTGIEKNDKHTDFIFESDSIGHIRIKKLNTYSLPYRLTISSVDGKILIDEYFNGSQFNFKSSFTNKRVYIINLRNAETNEAKKIIF